MLFCPNPAHKFLPSYVPEVTPKTQRLLMLNILGHLVYFYTCIAVYEEYTLLTIHESFFYYAIQMS